jgi:hypothetical protein
VYESESFHHVHHSGAFESGRSSDHVKAKGVSIGLTAPLSDGKWDGNGGSAKLLGKVRVARRHPLRQRDGRSKKTDRTAIDIETLEPQHAALSALEREKLRAATLLDPIPIRLYPRSGAPRRRHWTVDRQS